MAIFRDFNLILMGLGVNLPIIDTDSKLLIQGARQLPKGCDLKIYILGLINTWVRAHTGMHALKIQGAKMFVGGGKKIQGQIRNHSNEESNF